MDAAHTYGLQGTGERAQVYLPLNRSGRRTRYTPPLTLVARALDGTEQVFVLLDETVLDCGDTEDGNGTCKSWDCHRITLGTCLCGRHKPLGDQDTTDTRPNVRIRSAA